jgi:hypothetical protein
MFHFKKLFLANVSVKNRNHVSNFRENLFLENIINIIYNVIKSINNLYIFSLN